MKSSIYISTCAMVYYLSCGVIRPHSRSDFDSTFALVVSGSRVGVSVSYFSDLNRAYTRDCKVLLSWSFTVFVAMKKKGADYMYPKGM